jgi:hypothetical protein
VLQLRKAQNPSIIGGDEVVQVNVVNFHITSSKVQDLELTYRGIPHEAFGTPGFPLRPRFSLLTQRIKDST